MALQWSGEIRGIIESAERDALRMRVRMNTALLLRSMLKSPGRVRDVLLTAGVELTACERGLKNLQLQPEKSDAPQRVYDRAARLCISAQCDEVDALHVLLALLDETCLGQSLLLGLHYDLQAIRSIIYADSSRVVYSQRSSSQSMNSVMVQRKSPSARPATLIDPQPAASFGTGTDNFLESLRNESRQNMAVQRTRLLTPTEIETLHNGVSQLPLRNAGQSQLPLLNKATQPGTPEKRQSSVYRSTSREIQQATTLDLARRLMEKKSRTSEARRESREMKTIDGRTKTKTGEVPAQADPAARSDSPIANAVGITTASGTVSASVGAANQATSVASTADSAAPLSADAPITEVTNALPSDAAKSSAENSSVMPAIAERPRSPIISRRNLQAMNDAGSVFARRTAATAKLPLGFNPLALNPQHYPKLCEFGRNLLAEAAAGHLDPVIGRDHEIDQLIDILNKRRSNNPVLVGEAGVGKTAIIEGLALRMARSEAPRGLEQRTIIALDYGAILCGTQLRGAVQDRIKAIKNEVSKAQGRIILFLDEIHCWLANSNGDPNSDAAQELKMALSRGELKCIGASTPQELRRAFNADPTFERRFDFIEVKAPTPETSVRIIERGIIQQYARHHGVEYEPDSIRDAVRLSERYIQERALPDKAISVLDRAGSLCERSGEHNVTSNHVAQVIAQIAEIPVERLLMTERQKLMRMEEILGKRLIGHESNIARIASVIRRNHAGFGAKRPIGTFLFLGPTGVGKTEAAKVLADFLFGSPKNMVRFDMSEYMEQHSVAKLIGAPAGYVGFDDGGLLTEALRKRPYQIVLFDEIEKAHPDVMNIFLQIFDEGMLTDAKGRHVDFSNTVIIMTSNLGAAEVMRASQANIGFAGASAPLSREEAEDIIIRAAKERFPPELWNRIEERLVFHPLTIQQIERIAALLLEDSRKRLFSDKRIDLSFDLEALIPYLVQNGGFDPKYGARPMRQTIQSLVESRVAEWILLHDVLPKALFVGVNDCGVYVEPVADGDE